MNEMKSHVWYILLKREIPLEEEEEKIHHEAAMNDNFIRQKSNIYEMKFILYIYTYTDKQTVVATMKQNPCW